MTKVCFFLVVVLGSMAELGQAQDKAKTIAEKEHAFTLASDDSTRFAIATELHNLCLSWDYSKAEAYTLEMMSLAQKGKSERRIAISHHAFGRLAEQKRNYPKAIKSDSLALLSAESVGDSALTFMIWMNYCTHLADGEYATLAEEQFQTLNRWLNATNNLNWKGRFAYTYGAHLAFAFQMERAESHLNNAVNIYQTLGETKRLNRSKVFLARTYVWRNKYGEALNILTPLASYYQIQESTGSGASEFFNILTEALIMQGNIEAALSTLDEAISIKTIGNLETDAALLKLQKSLLLLDLGKTTEANALATPAAEVVAANNSSTGQFLYELFRASFNSHNGVFKKAVYHFKKCDDYSQTNISPSLKFEYFYQLARHYQRTNQIQEITRVIDRFQRYAEKVMDRTTYTTLQAKLIRINTGTSESLSGMEKTTNAGVNAQNVFHHADTVSRGLGRLFTSGHTTAANSFGSELLELERKYKSEALTHRLNVQSLIAQLSTKRAQQSQTIAISIASTGCLLMIFTLLLMRSRNKIQSMAKQALRDKDQIETLLQDKKHNLHNNFVTFNYIIKNIEEQDALDLSTLKSRIISIQRIHEYLYNDPGMQHIEMNPLISLVTKETLSLFNISSETTLQVTGNITLDANRSSILARIINELCTNSCKHAFKGISNKTIKITLNTEHSHFIITYSDNGVGKKANAVDSFGQKYIRSQIRGPLEGEIIENNEAGFSLIFKFPVNAKN